MLFFMISFLDDSIPSSTWHEAGGDNMSDDENENINSLSKCARKITRGSYLYLRHVPSIFYIFFSIRIPFWSRKFFWPWNHADGWGLVVGNKRNFTFEEDEGLTEETINLKDIAEFAYFRRFVKEEIMNITVHKPIYKQIRLLWRVLPMKQLIHLHSEMDE